ncbi:MAG: hypothetical protein ACRDWE_06640 [Acidimicrobiales bacterium]
MHLDDVIDAVADDLRRAAEIGGDETVRVADLLVTGIGPSLRLHFMEALHAVARELEASAPGAVVDVRLDGTDPVLSIAEAASDLDGAGAQGDGLGRYADDELLRLTIRLPQKLKARVEEAAQEAGASTNSWIAIALARYLDSGSGSGRQHASWPQPGRRIPRRMTGFVRG